MLGSPPPTTRRAPVSAPSLISPRRQKVVLNLYSGPRKCSAAAVEKSFVREAIVSGESGLSERTRSPVATSAISTESPAGRAGGRRAARSSASDRERGGGSFGVARRTAWRRLGLAASAGRQTRKLMRTERTTRRPE